MQPGNTCTNLDWGYSCACGGDYIFERTLDGKEHCFPPKSMCEGRCLEAGMMKTDPGLWEWVFAGVYGFELAADHQNTAVWSTTSGRFLTNGTLARGRLYELLIGHRDDESGRVKGLVEVCTEWVARTSPGPWDFSQSRNLMDSTSSGGFAGREQRRFSALCCQLFQNVVGCMERKCGGSPDEFTAATIAAASQYCDLPSTVAKSDFKAVHFLTGNFALEFVNVPAREAFFGTDGPFQRGGGADELMW